MLSSRAIHLELLDSMSQNDFILAFVRFSNKYGIPKAIYTDNARSFTSFTLLICNLVSSNVFSEKFIKHNIVHKTTPTYSPWYGAAWEKLIQTVKHCIYKTVGRNVVDYRNFITILSDIEVAINYRPLTYRDKTNSLEIVTPDR